MYIYRYSTFIEHASLLPHLPWYIQLAHINHIDTARRPSIARFSRALRHCSFFVILAPIHYHESGRLMSFWAM